MGKENAKSRYGKKVVHVSFGFNIEESARARKFYPNSTEMNKKAKELFNDHIRYLNNLSKEAKELKDIYEVKSSYANTEQREGELEAISEGIDALNREIELQQKVSEDGSADSKTRQTA